MTVYSFLLIIILPAGLSSDYSLLQLYTHNMHVTTGKLNQIYILYALRIILCYYVPRWMFAQTNILKCISLK